MLRKGTAQLRDFQRRGCTRFIVCYDTDDDSHQDREREARTRIINPANLPADSWLILIPQEEVEAWILADADHAIPHLFRTWTVPNETTPENIHSPKERLERLSRTAQHRENYHHTTHNLSIAPHLDLLRIACKCPSFRPLVRFVQGVNRPHPSAEILHAASRASPRAFVALNGTIHDAGQLGTSAQWEALAQFLMAQMPALPTVLHLIERSWAALHALTSEISTLLGYRNLRREVRPLLGMIQQIRMAHPDAEQLGVADGSRPTCPAHPPAPTTSRNRPQR